MAGLLHLFDHNSGSMAKKHKNHIGDLAGFESPRNSLESPADSFQSFYTAGESEQCPEQEPNTLDCDYYVC